MISTERSTRLKAHSKVRSRFYFRQTKRACEGQHRLLGRGKIGLAGGQGLDLGEDAQSLGRIQGNLDLVVLEPQMECLSLLANGGQGPESLDFEELQQQEGRLSSRRHGD